MSTNFKVPPGLSSVDIIDLSLSRFVNFQSEITFPEEGGILQVDNVWHAHQVDGLPHHVHGLLMVYCTVQVENFGMHINVDGTVLQVYPFGPRFLLFPF